MNAASISEILRIPSHVILFQCSQCGECCTSKWNIEADIISYERLYDKLKKFGREQELRANISNHNSAPRLRFLPNGKCPYLNSDQLCSLHQELGGEFLLDICKVYPRRIFLMDNTLEFSLSLTCKTAVNTLSKGPIDITLTRWADLAKVPFSFFQPNAIKKLCHKIYICIPEVELIYREFEDYCINLLQDNTETLGERLALLGHSLLDIPYIAKLEICKQRSTGLSGNLDLEKHLANLYSISNVFLLNSSSNEKCQTLRSILQAINGEQNLKSDTDDRSTRKKVLPPQKEVYMQKLLLYYPSIYQLGRQILENYAVNFILSKHFNFQSLPLAYYRLSFGYAAIIAFCIGKCLIENSTISQESILQSIYDVDTIFYDDWFYPYAAAREAGLSYRQIIENGVALSNIQVD